MTVRIYRSTDTSAPTLSGTAGDLITVLDAVLINGYTGHAAAGWTKAFTGTNSADYRMSTTSPSLGYYLDVNDNAPGAGGGRESRVRGYEVMTALATGTNLFPTVAQQATGLFVRKSVSADSVLRPWIIVADQRTFYMFIQTGDAAKTYLIWGFGEFFSFKTSGDFGRCALWARSNENNGGATIEPFTQMSGLIGTTSSNGIAARYIARSYTQLAAAVNASSLIADGSLDAARTLDYTNSVDNKVYLSNIRITENTSASTGVWRGRLRGLYQFPHLSSTASDGDTFFGSGDLSGRRFLIIKNTFNTTGSQGILVVEFSNTWDTNTA